MDPWQAAISTFEKGMRVLNDTALGGGPYVPYWRRCDPFLSRSRESLTSIASTAISPREAAKQCLMLLLKKNKTQQAAYSLERSIMSSVSLNMDREDMGKEGLSKHDGLLPTC